MVEYNELKLGDIVRPHTNDLVNVDYVTTSGIYKVIKLYKDRYGYERIDIECQEMVDSVFLGECPDDYSVVCEHCGK